MAEFISNSAILPLTSFSAALTGARDDGARSREMAEFGIKSAIYSIISKWNSTSGYWKPTESFVWIRYKPDWR